MKLAIQKTLLISTLLFSSVVSVKPMEKKEITKKSVFIEQAEYVMSQLTTDELMRYRLITHDWQTLAPGALQLSISSQFETIAMLCLAEAKAKYASKKQTTNINTTELLYAVCNAHDIDINKKLSYVAAIVAKEKNLNMQDIMKQINDAKLIGLIASAYGLLGCAQSFATNMGYKKYLL